MVPQITGVSVVCSNVCSGTDQRKHQSSMSLAFVRGIHRSLVDSPHKGPVMWEMLPFDDVIMRYTIALSWWWDMGCLIYHWGQLHEYITETYWQYFFYSKEVCFKPHLHYCSSLSHCLVPFGASASDGSVISMCWGHIYVQNWHWRGW